MCLLRTVKHKYGLCFVSATWLLSLRNCSQRPRVTSLAYSIKHKWLFSLKLLKENESYLTSCKQNREVMRSENEKKQKVFKLAFFKGIVKKTDLFYMLLPDTLGVAAWRPLMGVPPRSLVSTSHHEKKNIQADPRTAHTQSKANTRCHVRGLSHVLICFWPLMSSPECPGWYPHHPVGWLTPLNRKGQC